MAENNSFEDKVLGCMIGGFIGDSIGTPTEGKDFKEIEIEFGYVNDFTEEGTDDTIMKFILAKTLIRTGGWGKADDWAVDWLENIDFIYGSKQNRFFASVIHTLEKFKRNFNIPPRLAALGNMPSSSSAMCISPVGIVNAGNPQMAAMQAYDFASLIHTHDVAFCQDGAAMIAAATAQAFVPDTTIDTIIESAKKFIAPVSGSYLLDTSESIIDIAKCEGNYVGFRNKIYEQRDKYFYDIICDSRETVPITFGLLYLSQGSIEEAACFSANFGRDSDTIGTMCASITGAYSGASSLPKQWYDKAIKLSVHDQVKLTGELVETARQKQSEFSDQLKSMHSSTQ